MRDTWYGDKRDLVKWGTMAHLTEREAIDLIVQVPYLRPGQRPPLHTPNGPADIQPAVWKFFRNVPAVEALGATLGRRVIVISDEFKPRNRDLYRRLVTDRLTSLPQRKVVLLDPDTGLTPSKAAAEHVSEADVQAIWSSLRDGDWLVLYQHASRSKGWREEGRSRYARLCGVGAVEMFTAPKIASDVTLFAAKKTAAS